MAIIQSLKAIHCFQVDVDVHVSRTLEMPDQPHQLPGQMMREDKVGDPHVPLKDAD